MRYLPFPNPPPIPFPPAGVEFFNSDQLPVKPSNGRAVYLGNPRLALLGSSPVGRKPPSPPLFGKVQRYDRLTKCWPKRIQRGIHILLNANIPD